MKKTKRFPMVSGQLQLSLHEKGSALITVILVLAFFQVIGIVLLSVTGAGPKIAGNIRTQQQAYNAAESGVDVSWVEIEEFFAIGAWASFNGHYLKEPSGIDDPKSDDYFRKKTDLELLNLIDPNGDGTPDVSSVVFYREPYIRTHEGSFDLRYTYTVFLIDDEAGGGTPDPADTLLVCIGCIGTGNNVTTSRVEVELAIASNGT